MNQRSKNLFSPFVSHCQSAEVLQPGIASLNDPPALVPPHLPAVLMSGDFVIASRRDDRLDSLSDEHCPHSVAVISTIADQPLRPASFAGTDFDPDLGQRSFDQCHFRRGRLLQVYSERSTCAIGQY
jgi:hypothetical protein